MIWHKDMSLVLNIIKPQQLIKNIQIIACIKKKAIFINVIGMD